MTQLAGKNILVTGGCGSIGTPLVKRILEHDPTTVRVFDNDEKSLFNLRQEMGGDDRLRYLLGDVRDQNRLELAVEEVDIVFHAAALKHVAINEYNPFETVQTNVQGTQNLIRAALEEEVESFVGVSTDKASNPSSVMGATKLLAERLITAANTYKGRRETRLGCVRFGNVLGTSGSVVPVFLDQIRQGGPVTVTNPEMTRFIMPIDNAANLVIDAQKRITNGEVFVLKMPAFRVGTLAETMIKEFAPQFGYEADDISIETIGERPGERIHEKLISIDEKFRSRELEDMYVILPDVKMAGYDPINYSDADPVTDEYTSADEKLLSSDEIVEIINSNIDIGGIN